MSADSAIVAIAKKNRAGWEAALADHPVAVKDAWRRVLDALDDTIQKGEPNAIVLSTQLRLFTDLAATFRARGNPSLATRIVHYAMAYYSPTYSHLLEKLTDADIVKLDAMVAGMGKTFERPI